MGLGKLPGALAATGKGLVRGASEIGRGMISGGYEAAPAGAPYDTVDPRQSYWHGMSRDMGRAIANMPYQDNAHRSAKQARDYNRLGPERYREQEAFKQKQQQAKMTAKIQRLTLEKAEQTRQQYQAYVQKTLAGGGQPLPQDAWENQLGMKGNQRPPRLQMADELGQASARGDEQTLGFLREANRAPSMVGGVPVVAGGAGGAAQMDIPAIERLNELLASREGMKAAGKSVATRNMEFDEFMGGAYAETTDQLAELERIIADYESGAYDETTGLVVGRASPYMTEKGASQFARSIYQTLEALKTVNLAPVSDNEFANVQKTAENPALSVEANIGILKVARDKIKRGLNRADQQERHFKSEGTLEGYRYRRPPAGGTPVDTNVPQPADATSAARKKYGL